jgi:hypothetical protein
VSSLEKAAPTAVEFGRAEAGAEAGRQLLIFLQVTVGSCTHSCCRNCLLGHR